MRIYLAKKVSKKNKIYRYLPKKFRFNQDYYFSLVDSCMMYMKI